MLISYFRFYMQYKFFFILMNPMMRGYVKHMRGIYQISYSTSVSYFMYCKRVTLNWLAEMVHIVIWSTCLNKYDTIFWSTHINIVYIIKYAIRQPQIGDTDIDIFNSHYLTVKKKNNIFNLVECMCEFNCFSRIIIIINIIYKYANKLFMFTRFLDLKQFNWLRLIEHENKSIRQNV